MKPLTYLNVLAFMSQYFLDNWEADIQFNHGQVIVDIITDSDGNIQVNLLDEEEEPLDWGGVVTMQDDDDGNEWTRIEKILKRNNPEQLSKLVTEKALFIWELCFDCEPFGDSKQS